MNTAIKAARVWLDAHPKCQQWVWFGTLWCAGLLAVSAVAYPLKLIIRAMG